MIKSFCEDLGAGDHGLDVDIFVWLMTKVNFAGEYRPESHGIRHCSGIGGAAHGDGLSVLLSGVFAVDVHKGNHERIISGLVERPCAGVLGDFPAERIADFVHTFHDLLKSKGHGIAYVDDQLGQVVFDVNDTYVKSQLARRLILEWDLHPFAEDV